MRNRITTLVRRGAIPLPSAPTLDTNRVTMRLHKGRLCLWPGNVQRWIERNKADELVVDHYPCIGHVAAAKVDNAEEVYEALPSSMQNWLASGMAVVIGREHLPETVRGRV